MLSKNGIIVYNLPNYMYNRYISGRSILLTSPSIRLIDPIYFRRHSVTNLIIVFFRGLLSETLNQKNLGSTKIPIKVSLNCVNI